MKKTILIIFTIICISVTIIFVKYSAYKTEYSKILKGNSEFEEYTNKEIYGLELATLINKAIDKNAANDEDSIEIEIYMKDNEQIYKMQTFYRAGMEQFIKYYGNIKFKCSKIEYNKETKKIEYLFFEQVITS